MKVLQVIPTLDQGGAEHFVTELSVALVNLGVSCDVVTLFDIQDNNNLGEKLRDNHIQLFSLHKKEGPDLSIFFKLIKLIRKGKYNVVHTHIGATKYILLAAFLLPSVRLVTTLHSEARREAGKSLDLWSRKLMFNFKKCIPVTISEESERSFESFYGYNAEIILNGVSEYKKQKDISVRDNNDQIVFIHPASCQPVKNQELLLKAFARLTEEYSNSKLIWVGNVDAYKDLYEQLKTMMVPQVEYHGIVPNVRDYLSKADAMCLSSKMEGLPMTVIEAFSVGCVPICTPVGGCNNIIHNWENGILSSDLTIESYYSALKSYCELSREEKNRLKEESRKSYKEFDIVNCAESYISLYKNGIKKN